MRAYKVVKLICGEFVSPLTQKEYCLNYKIGEKLTPKYPVFLFKTYRDARHFREDISTSDEDTKDYPILKCEIKKHEVKLEYVCSIMNPADFPAFWEGKPVDMVAKLCNSVVIADEVIPLELKGNKKWMKRK